MLTLDNHLHVLRQPSTQAPLALVERVGRSLGGKGWVTASTLALLGADVVLTTLVSQRSRVARESYRYVHGRYLPVLSKDHEVWIITSADGPDVTYVALATPRSDQALQRYVVPPDFSSDVVAVYLAAEDPTLLQACMLSAERSNLPLVVNCSSALLAYAGAENSSFIGSIVGSANTLLMNVHESREVLGALGKRSWNDFVGGPLQEIVITDSIRGGSYSSRPFDRWDHYEAVAALPGGTETGAGDSFNAGYLLARFGRSESLAAACCYGASIAARCVGTLSSSIVNAAI
jgi:sugar/nucleoside kinase (ribokinase family)